MPNKSVGEQGIWALSLDMLAQETWKSVPGLIGVRIRIQVNRVCHLPSRRICFDNAVKNSGLVSGVNYILEEPYPLYGLDSTASVSRQWHTQCRFPGYYSPYAYGEGTVAEKTLARSEPCEEDFQTESQ